MKKTYLKTLLLFLIILETAFASLQLSDEEKRWIQDNPKIKVAMAIDNKPYSFKMNNVPMGLDFDLLDIIENKTELRFERIQNSWGESVHNFKTKQVDMITSFGYLKERTAYSLYTKSYSSLNLILRIYTKKDFQSKTDKSWVENFQNKKIGIVKNVFFKKDLLEKGFSDLKKYDSIKDLLEALSLGKVDLIMVNKDLHSSIEKMFSNIHKFTELELTNARKRVAYIGVNKDKKILHSILDKTLESITPKDLKDLEQKWKIFLSEKSGMRLTQEESQYLASKEQIKVCIAPSWVPFEEFTKEGEHSGISADILEIISKKIEKNFMIIPTKNWNESIESIRSNKCEVLPLAMKTSNRLGVMNFTKAYIIEPIVVATKLDEIYIRDENQLSNKRVGVIENSAIVDILKIKNPNIDVVLVKNIKQGLQKVRSGELFAYIGTIPAIGYAIQKHGFVDLKIAGKLDEELQLSIGSIKSDPLLNSIMEKALQSISQEEIRRVVGRWIEIKVQQEFDYKTLFYVVAIFIVIVGVVLYQNRVIRKKVQEAVEKNQEQERLIFFQSKLATMGETINIIAHQWRQPISLISSRLSSIQVDIEYKKELEEEKILKTIKSAQSDLKHLSSTISLFQNYLKPKNVSSNETFEINETVERSIKLFEAIFKKYEIEVKNEICEYMKIQGNQEYFIQVLMVLLSNSKDAIINNQPEKPFIKFAIEELEDTIVFFFEDNAKGIHIEENIFDPYISGKNSTGLGLFIAKNIVNKIFHGEIYHENTDVGAKFSIHFPI